MGGIFSWWGLVVYPLLPWRLWLPQVDFPTNSPAAAGTTPTMGGGCDGLDLRWNISSLRSPRVVADDPSTTCSATVQIHAAIRSETATSIGAQDVANVNPAAAGQRTEKTATYTPPTYRKSTPADSPF